MMHLKVSDTSDPQLVNVQLSLVGIDELAEFRKLLDRSLNCNPEAGKKWFELSDKLDQLITAAKI